MQTERLVIEPLARAHAAALFAALDDPRVGTYIGGPDVTTMEALERRIDALAAGPPAEHPEDRWANWVARRAADGTVIGRLEATTYPDGWAEVAWVFGPAYWGAGYATEGATWMRAHLVAECGISELWAAVHPDNAGSIRLLGRLGFERQPAPPARPLGSYDEGDLVFAWWDR
jgi:RimJ/RimL family protein N-acetyltransferase